MVARWLGILLFTRHARYFLVAESDIIPIIQCALAFLLCKDYLESSGGNIIEQNGLLNTLLAFGWHTEYNRRRLKKEFF